MLHHLSKILFASLLSLTCTAMCFASSATELQKKADIFREKGESLQAIDLYNQAIVAYQETKDYSNMMGALTGRLLSWKHLFYKTEDKIYAIFVKKEAEQMLEVAKEHNLSHVMHLIHFLHGTSASLLNNYTYAALEFKQAVDLYPSENAEKGDWIAHLGDAMYQAGQKEEGKNTILEGISLIKERSTQIDSFLYNVWVSGAYLRLAKLLHVDNPDESLLFLDRAREIIDSDNRLVIRKEQLSVFTKHMKMDQPTSNQNSIKIQILQDSAVAPRASDLVKISNIVYKEYPYLYDVEDNEQFYISHYCHSPEVKLCLVLDGTEAIGYAIGIPLKACSPSFKKPFEELDLDFDSFFYVAELGLLPEYRTRGIGKQLLLQMEELVRKEGKYSQICLAHIDESLILENKPINYVSLSSLWSHLNYQPYPHLAIYLSWKNVGATDASMHKLIYWIKSF